MLEISAVLHSVSFFNFTLIGDIFALVTKLFPFCIGLIISESTIEIFYKQKIPLLPHIGERNLKKK